MSLPSPLPWDEGGLEAGPAEGLGIGVKDGSDPETENETETEDEDEPPATDVCDGASTLSTLSVGSTNGGLDDGKPEAAGLPSGVFGEEDEDDEEDEELLLLTKTFSEPRFILDRRASLARGSGCGDLVAWEMLESDPLLGHQSPATRSSLLDTPVHVAPPDTASSRFTTLGLLRAIRFAAGAGEPPPDYVLDEAQMHVQAERGFALVRDDDVELYQGALRAGPARLYARLRGAVRLRRDIYYDGPRRAELAAAIDQSRGPRSTRSPG